MNKIVWIFKHELYGKTLSLRSKLGILYNNIYDKTQSYYRSQRSHDISILYYLRGARESRIF